jgi:hypothetical protein
MNKICDLISSCTFKYSDIINNYPELATLLDLFRKFTSQHRNRYAHGIRDDFINDDLLKYLYLVDKLLIIYFDKMLRITFNKSAFDKPGTWSNQPIKSRKESIEEAVKRLALGKLLKTFYKLDDVKAKLKTSQINIHERPFNL